MQGVFDLLQMYKIFFFYSYESLFFVVNNQSCFRECFLLIWISEVVGNGDALLLLRFGVLVAMTNRLE